jgi:phage protein D
MDRTSPVVLIQLIANDGTEVELGPELQFQDIVLSMTYQDLDKKTDKWTLVLDNFYLDLFDSGVFLRGNTMDVMWGYPGAMSPKRRMTITAIKGFHRLTVEAYPEFAVKLNRHRECHTYRNVTRSDVARIIAERNELSALSVIQDSKIVYETINQAAETDAQLLRRLASREGWEFYVDYTGLHFHERQFGVAPIRKFIYYSDPGKGTITKFNVTSEIYKRVGVANVMGRDPESREDVGASADNDNADRDTLGEETDMFRDLDTENLVDGIRNVLEEEEILRISRSVGSGASEEEIAAQIERVVNAEQEATEAAESGLCIELDPGPGRTVNCGPSSPNSRSSTTASSEDNQEAVDRRAQARYRLSERTTFEASMEIIGDAGVVAKSIVEIEGISQLLSGKYYVEEATHKITPGNYRVRMKLIRDGAGRYAARLTALRGSRNINDIILGIFDLQRLPDSAAVFDLYVEETGSSISPDAPTLGQINALNAWALENQELIEERLGRSPTSEEMPRTEWSATLQAHQQVTEGLFAIEAEAARARAEAQQGN